MNTGTRLKIGIIGAVMVAIMWLGIWIFTPSKPKDNLCDEAKKHAITIEYSDIINTLKSPATAKFGLPECMKATATNYTINGYVDSQNSFGATIRTKFYIILNYNGTGDADDFKNWTYQIIYQ